MNIKAKTQEILTQYGLDFQIHKLPLQAIHNGQVVGSPYFGLLNDKTGEIINSCKEGYRVSQNEEVVELVLEGMKDFGELSVKFGGEFNGGRKIYLQLGIEGHSKVGEDVIKRYVTVIDSNDGSTGLSVGVGDLTMSCQNQFFKFYKAGEAKFRHSASMDEKIKQIPQLIKLSLAQSMRMIEIYNEFQSNKISRDLAHKMVNHVLGFDKTTDKVILDEKSSRSLNAMETLYDHITKEMNQKGDNLWGLHSGVTSWTTHEKSAPTRDNGRLESVMIGTNYKTNQKSLDFALAMAGIK